MLVKYSPLQVVSAAAFIRQHNEYAQDLSIQEIEFRIRRELSAMARRWEQGNVTHTLSTMGFTITAFQSITPAGADLPERTKYLVMEILVDPAVAYDLDNIYEEM